MANLKEIRNRIASVKSTKQITSAMKMVSASKLRKAQDAVVRLRPYANKMHEIIEHISASGDVSDANVYTKAREPKKILLVVVTSNKGLCGAFNSNVVKQAINLINNEYKAQYHTGNLEILAIGKKAEDIFKSKSYKIARNENQIYNNLTFATAKVIADSLMNDFVSAKYDRIDLIYNRFKNAASQNLTVEQYLPVKPAETNKKIKHDYIFEPYREHIIDTLLPDSLRTQLYSAIIDSNAAEHGARMTAMHQATDNATEMIKSLTLNYNKARQASITNEILEIVAGATALQG